MTLSEELAESYPRPRLLAIDPWTCGCTECGEGTYKPLREAAPEEIATMLTGDLRNHTGITFTMTATIAAAIPYGGTLRTATTEHEVIISCEYRSWTVSPHLLGIPIR
ncbi:hypothetical protein [Nonomuraea basaltis]|uniref:hypothetical protein n=1 Tax=Nonomuraea basaltis TaxID=2495887 RepID=UPI00110C4A70|nr:hypothetical protein [Nonomuraea basaltis]TMR92569.1 hypothetical protein EJK15_43995 [Nonomuraea basaltis]